MGLLNFQTQKLPARAQNPERTPAGTQKTLTERSKPTAAGLCFVPRAGHRGLTAAGLSGVPKVTQWTGLQHLHPGLGLQVQCSFTEDTDTWQARGRSSRGQVPQRREILSRQIEGGSSSRCSC